MEIHLDGVPAAALARLAVHVGGPGEAEALTRLAAAGELSVPLGRLVAALEATGIPRAEAAATVRALIVRLEAGGVVERLGGGYRLVDRAFLPVPAAGTTPPGASAPPLPVPVPPGTPQITPGPAAALPTASGAAAHPAPDPAVSAYLQRAAVHRYEGTTAAGAAATLPGRVVAALAAKGWAPLTALPSAVAVQRQDAGAPALVVALTSPSPPSATTPAPAAYAPPPPVRADVVASEVVMRLPAAPTTLVADAANLPTAAAVNRQRPGTTFVFDMRAVPPQGAAVAATGPARSSMSPTGAPAVDPAASAIAGAAGVAAPVSPRRSRRRLRVGDLAELFEALFGPRFVDLLGPWPNGGPGDGPDAEVDSSGDQPVTVLLLAAPETDLAALPDLEAGDCPLTVEVVVMAGEDPALEEVLAFLEDDGGARLLAPLT